MEKLPQREVWPPEPIKPYAQKTVVVKSKEMLGLLTNHYLIDFLLGLVLGPIVFLMLLFVFGIVAQLFVPQLPTPKWIMRGSWAFPVVVSFAAFALLILRYPYLMIGFITSTIATAGFSYICGLIGGAL